MTDQPHSPPVTAKKQFFRPYDKDKIVINFPLKHYLCINLSCHCLQFLWNVTVFQQFVVCWWQIAYCFNAWLQVTCTNFEIWWFLNYFPKNYKSYLKNTVLAAWKSHGKWCLFSRPGIVMEFVKKWQKSWTFQTLILIIKIQKIHTRQLVHFCRI